MSIAEFIVYQEIIVLLGSSIYFLIRLLKRAIDMPEVE